MMRSQGYRLPKLGKKESVKGWCCGFWMRIFFTRVWTRSVNLDLYTVFTVYRVCQGQCGLFQLQLCEAIHRWHGAFELTVRFSGRCCASFVVTPAWCSLQYYQMIHTYFGIIFYKWNIFQWIPLSVSIITLALQHRLKQAVVRSRL